MDDTRAFFPVGTTVLVPVAFIRDRVRLGVEGDDPFLLGEVVHHPDAPRVVRVEGFLIAVPDDLAFDALPPPADFGRETGQLQRSAEAYVEIDRAGRRSLVAHLGDDDCEDADFEEVPPSPPPLP